MISINDIITGQDVTMGTMHTGRVVAIIKPVRYSGDTSPRYRIDVEGGRSRIVFA